MMTLTDRVAIISGSGHAIGREIAWLVAVHRYSFGEIGSGDLA